VKVEVACCDVTDEGGLSDLFKRLRAERPIKGVMHVAVLLEDTLIKNLTNEKIHRVLDAKVKGGEYLDRVTREDALDYFLLFSSSSALFGNPGQANYVAANAYLDGLARKRRAEGLTALSVQWGAITDVGILVRQADTAKSLARHTGGVEFRARQGLDLLGQLLVSDNGAPEGAVVSLAAMNWSFAGDLLPIMRNPIFAMMAREASGSSHGAENVDLHSLIAGLEDTEARDKIALLVAEEASSIFRMPVEEINLQRSLVELGMDSLMGMELFIAAEQKLGVEIPMTSVGDGTTINDIASKILGRLRNESSGEEVIPSAAETLAHKHLKEEGVDKDVLSSLVEKVDMQINQSKVDT
jgi:acyl carrier protein